MKHTPGPWGVEPGRPSGGVNGARIIAATGELVARLTYKADKPLYQKEADARLIAAAPDMLQALKQCLGILCESGNLNNYRNLSDAELGKAWIEAAKHAAEVLNEAEGVPQPADAERVREP